MNRAVLLCVMFLGVIAYFPSPAKAAVTTMEAKHLASQASHGNTRSLNRLQSEAHAGNFAAQKYLGDLYKKGEGIHKDLTKAAEWYRRAGKGGLASAQAELGFLFYKGRGVGKDYSKAAEWWEKAAKQGDAAAQSNLGVLFFKGQGVSQDYTKAAKFWLEAAEQGDPPSQYNIGYAYFKGQGVQRDFVKAYKWFSLSASGSKTKSFQDSANIARNVVEKLMTTEQLVQAKMLLKSSGKKQSNQR